MQILITYSSGYGTTREVAERIGQVLTVEPLFHVELVSIDEVTSIRPYEAVILGSSVRASHPLANVVDFLALHRHELENKQVALFLVCLEANSAEGRCKVRHEHLPQLLDRFPTIHPIAAEAFGGKIDFARLNPVMQSLMRRVLEQTALPTEGSVDTRDWAFIEQWAADLRQKLLSLQPSSPVENP
ncbi:MAG TPA: flavodoxin domain-containing protein [bacterium]|nr:flavodoxin domain-containing protein [bacterium]HQI47120.1 flavodoxin domain-containing protein [bacterium]HQJ63162.1 flavodoxin domain-containing protein [bacterium]